MRLTFEGEGPRIEDVAQALTDGFPTVSGLGFGGARYWMYDLPELGSKGPGDFCGVVPLGGGIIGSAVRFARRKGSLGMAFPRRLGYEAFDVEEDDQVFVRKDGLRGRFDARRCPHPAASPPGSGFADSHKAAVAGLFYRDSSRRSDDAALLVIWIRPEGRP